MINVYVPEGMPPRKLKFSVGEPLRFAPFTWSKSLPLAVDGLPFQGLADVGPQLVFALDTDAVERELS